MSDAARSFDPSTITRPDARLMKYYVIVALLSVFAFPITLFVLWIKYRTLRYRFDDEGIWRAQGLLWRSEVNVTYRRIQDIHLTNGLLQRWLGLSTVSIQTAAPLRSRMALVPMVVPCTTRPVAGSATFSLPSALSRPRAGSAAVVGDLPTSRRPVVVLGSHVCPRVRKSAAIP